MRAQLMWTSNSVQTPHHFAISAISLGYAFIYFSKSWQALQHPEHRNCLLSSLVTTSTFGCVSVLFIRNYSSQHGRSRFCPFNSNPRETCCHTSGNRAIGTDVSAIVKEYVNCLGTPTGILQSMQSCDPADEKAVSDLVLNVCQFLEIPQDVQWHRVDEDGKVEEPRVTTLKDNADITFKALRLFLDEVHTIVDRESQYRLIVRCAAFLGDTSQKWSTSSSIASANAIISHIASKSKTKRSLLASRYAERILTEEIKPHFSHRKVDDTGHRVDEIPTVRAQHIGAGEEYERQPWKVLKPDCVPILHWVVTNLEHGQIGPIQHLLFPPLLQLLDDYEQPYKMIGLNLFRHAIIECSAPMDIRRTGLGDVFFSTLLPYLTYHENPPLVQEALDCIIDLIPVIEVKDSQPFHKRLEDLCYDGICRNLTFAIGGNVKIIRALVGAIPKVAHMMGIMSIQFLSTLLGPSCEILELHQHDLETQIVCCNAIIGMMKSCYPRVPAYRGVVLAAIAKAWRDLSREKSNNSNSSELSQALRDAFHLLQAICGDKLKGDTELLLKMDSNLFQPLFQPSEDINGRKGPQTPGIS
ncbi:hypothetical protein DFS34DRAFT_233293 [Phlyctochytrium arcticum]|nr:hypothetical protein DFS34DRAFT_233293 [Phlyctochytrium arcticum]